MIVTLDREHWDVLITNPEYYVKDLTYPYPMVAASGPEWFSDEPPPTIEAHHEIATVQLTRRDGANAIEFYPGKRFCIARVDYSVLEVMQREGPCVVLRCAMRSIPEAQP